MTRIIALFALLLTTASAQDGRDQPAGHDANGIFRLIPPGFRHRA
jgi:hypothetical protein